jgi:hypothetical protein
MYNEAIGEQFAVANAVDVEDAEKCEEKMEGTVYRPGRGCTGRLSAGLDHNRPEGE